MHLYFAFDNFENAKSAVFSRDSGWGRGEGGVWGESVREDFGIIV